MTKLSKLLNRRLLRSLLYVISTIVKRPLLNTTPPILLRRESYRRRIIKVNYTPLRTS